MLGQDTADGDVVMDDADTMVISGIDEDVCKMHTKIYQTLAEKCKERDVRYVSFALGLDGDEAEGSSALITFMDTIVADEERRRMVTSSGCTTLYTYYARWNAFLVSTNEHQRASKCTESHKVHNVQSAMMHEHVSNPVKSQNTCVEAN